MRSQLRRVMALPVMPFGGGEDGVAPFPYEAVYVALLLAPAVALAAWVVYGPI